MIKKIGLLCFGTLFFLNGYALSSNELYQQIPQNASAAQLSIPLLASGLEHNSEIYHTLLPRILQTLSLAAEHPLNGDDITTTPSYQAWLLGRVLLAAKYMEDKTTEEKISNTLLGLLQSNTIANDEFYTWAWAYLVNYYATKPELYEKYKAEMFNATDYYVTRYPNQTKNIMWARVLELQAVAAANDKIQFEALLNILQRDAHQNSLVKSLEMIPLENGQAWAKAIVMNAAAKVEDIATYEIMKQATEQAVLIANEKNDFKSLDSAIMAKLISQHMEQPASILKNQAIVA